MSAIKSPECYSEQIEGRTMPYASHFLRVVPAGIALILTFSCISISSAQSGRRARTPAPPTPPVPTPEPTPTPGQPIDKEKNMLTFRVGMDRYQGFSTIPLQYYDTVVRACADRLDDAAAVRSDPIRGEINRAKAISLAKAEKTAYVVFLQLKLESRHADPTIVDNTNDLYIEYSVYEPGTGKLLTWGHAYQG
ncbi:MAG: hypothetical protein ABR501_10690, partial [Pyrinomonadaceae bacterium]